MVCNKDRALANIDNRQSPDVINNGWQVAAVDQILDKYIEDGTRSPSPWNSMTFACVTSVEDAYRIRSELAVRSRLPVSIDFIQPWMDAMPIFVAASLPSGINIMCIDPQGSIIRPLRNLKAVILAPVFSRPMFDINVTGVVTTKVSYDVADALANSLRGFVQDEAGRNDVYTPLKLAWPDSTAPVDLQPPKQKADISTASNEDFIHLTLGSTLATDALPTQIPCP